MRKASAKHVISNKGIWGVKSSGGVRASKRFGTKGEAVEYAKEIAIRQKVCMVVHDSQGKFEKFDCTPEVRNQHVVQNAGNWAVIEAGGKNVSGIFANKGSAMAHAYDIATRHNVCMLVHDKMGNFKSVTCPSSGSPGILEIFRMKLKV
jgi:hypothetical protein